MVRPVDLNDFYLQAESTEKIHQIKKTDPETEKKQFEKELAKKKEKRKRGDKKPLPGETSEPESIQEDKNKVKPDSDHHIDLTV